MAHHASAPTRLGEYSTKSPAEALKQILSLKLSGRLTINDPRDRSVSWRLYLSKGDIHFAHSMMGYHERLSYLLQQQQFELDLAQLNQFPSDYSFLCHCWESGHLSLQELRKFLLVLTQEALVQILALRNPTVQFEYLVKLDPILLSMPLERIVLPVGHLITQWKGLWLVMGSPFQQPFIAKQTQFSQSPAFTYPNQHLKQKLIKVLGRNHSLYQVAQSLKMSVTEVAHMLSPFVQNSSVAIRPYASREIVSPQPGTQAKPQQEPKLNQDQKLKEYHLLIFPDGQHRVLTLDAANYSIGRHQSNSIALNHRSISRTHATLCQTQLPQGSGYQYRLIDGNTQGKPSTNGTYVNGQKCQTHVLVAGDTIHFGPDIHVIYEKVSMDEAAFQAYLDSFNADSIPSGPVDPNATFMGLEADLNNDTEEMTTILSSGHDVEVMSVEAMK